MAKTQRAQGALTLGSGGTRSQHSSNNAGISVADVDAKIALFNDQTGRDNQRLKTTYLSKDQARLVIDPVLREVKYRVNTLNIPTVAGWDERLERWFMRMERGNRTDHRTPMLEDWSYAALEKTINQMIFSGHRLVDREYPMVPGFYKEFAAREASQARKIGPKGVFPPYHVWGPEKERAVWSQKPYPVRFNRKAYLMALDDLRRLLPKGSVHAENLEDSWPSTSDAATHEDSKILNTATNSCFPHYVSHWFHADLSQATSEQQEVQRLLMKQAREIWYALRKAKDWREIPLHFVGTANTRFVSAGHDKSVADLYKGDVISKCRFVVAMPKLDTLLGKPLLNPLLDKLKQVRNPDGTRMFCALTGQEVIDKNLHETLINADKANQIVLSVDFSAFDASIPPWLLWDVNQVMSEWFDDESSKVFKAISYAEIFKTSLISPSGITSEQPSSVKSGSIKTNVDDSCVNYVSQRYCLHAGYFQSIDAQFMQGDDGLIRGQGVTPEAFERGTAELNLSANHEKQYYKKGSLMYLQKMHVLGAPGGIYPLARALNSCLTLEDEVRFEVSEGAQFKFMLLFATLSRLDNCCFNPAWMKLLNFIIQHDKLRLGKGYDPKMITTLAGDYAKAWEQEWKLKPWKAPGGNSILRGFASRPINRALRGDLPPKPGYELFKWVYGVSYDEVAL